MNGVSAAVLVIGALACGLLALALWLFARARQQENAETIEATLQRSLDIQRELQVGHSPLPMADPQPSTAALPPDSLVQRLSGHLGMEPRMLAVLVAGSAVVALIGGLLGNAVIGLALFAVCMLLSGFGIWMRKSKLRKKMLEQLPGFLDNMVRLISIGNSPQAAFQFASTNIPEPLSGALRHASASLNVSVDLSQPMLRMERTWGLAEFGLLAAVFRMSTRYGGRADLVLERVSAYIRDRLSAERELHALSAEVRLSAWILAMLPIVVGALIMVLNPGFFMNMWNDPTGRKLIIGAGVLQAFGSFLLYRLARLK